MKKISLPIIVLLFLLSESLYADDRALLFNGNCITCHHMTEALSAPSMREVKRHYKSVFSKKEDFVNYMALFILNPTQEHSIMSEEVKKYKLMPLLGYEQSVAKEIASYIYDTEF